MSGLTESQREAVRQYLVWAIPGRWKNQELAGRELGASQEYLSQLRSGKKAIGPSVALKVARAAGVTFEDLLSGRALRMATTKPSPKRSLSPTPTPAPASRLRSSSSTCPLPESPVNRQRALDLLAHRGEDRDRVDEEFALIAFDEGLSPFEDRPVAWWIDCYRARMRNDAP
jgi:hypothetical protein